jgi:acylphosphatase
VAGQAQRLGVRGFARNLEDGSVEVVAQGPDDAVDALARALATGPTLARVADVENTDVPHDIPAFNTFKAM